MRAIGGPRSTDAGLSQLDLSNKIYRRQPALSDMEKGKIEVDTSTLVMLADVLRKPLSYFFPWQMYKELAKEDLDPLQEEALLQFREIRGSNLQKLAIQIIRTMRNYDPKDLVIELADYVKDRLKREKSVEQLAQKRHKKK
jgi:transcriptional regulator with XRE-family HTH domain